MPPTNNTDSHIPGVYQGSPDVPKTVLELSPIRTMKNDIADAVKDQNESLVSIAEAENRKKDAERAMKSEEGTAVSTVPRPISRIIIVVVLVLVFVGIALSYKFVLPKILKINLPKLSIPSFGSTTTEPRPSTPTDSRVDLAPSLIKATTEKRFNTSKETPKQIFADIASLRVSGGTQGDIKNFYFYEDISAPDGSRPTDLADTIPQNRKTASISANKLIILTGISAPGILARSLENIFMAGLLHEETGSPSSPFIILKVSNNDTGLAGMLEWEQSLPHFFDIIFGTNIEAGLSDNIKVRDVVLSSRDARVLEITPATGIAYSFANPSTIIITGTRNALEKLLLMIPAK